MFAVIHGSISTFIYIIPYLSDLVNVVCLLPFQIFFICFIGFFLSFHKVFYELFRSLFTFSLHDTPHFLDLSHPFEGVVISVLVSISCILSLIFLCRSFILSSLLHIVIHTMRNPLLPILSRMSFIICSTYCVVYWVETMR